VTRKISKTSRRELSLTVFPARQGAERNSRHSERHMTVHTQSYATFKNWVAQFKRGDFSTCDAPRPGRPWKKLGYVTMTRKQNNNQWSGGIADHLANKKFRVQNPAGKFLASNFWDQYGTLLFDYLPKGQTINAQYYSFLLVQLKDF
jgi:hypothetical protein